MILSQVIQPKIITIKRRQNQGFGFTLRHFIAYPPEPWADTSDSYQRKGMETIFIKEVHPNGPAYLAGLKTGDRILMVNNISVAGISYSTIVSMIKQTPTVLKLQVVPKECDILQMYYTDIAHNPETNRPTIDIDRPLMPITSTTTNNTHNNFHSRLISYSPEGCPAITSTIHQPNLNLQKCIHSFGSDEYLLDECQLRPKQQNLSVLQKPNNDEFMIRLRKSIEQKEEFLKSPAPNTSKTNFQYQQEQCNRSSSPSILTTTSSAVAAAAPTTATYNITKTSVSSCLNKKFNTNVNKFLKNENEFLIASNAFSNSNNISGSSCNSFNRNIGENFGASCAGNQTGFYRNSNQFIPTAPNSKIIQIRTTNSPINFDGEIDIINNSDTAIATTIIPNNSPPSMNNLIKKSIEQQINEHRNYNNSHHITNVNINSGAAIKDKFHKELEFLESLPEMGVTNQVFERKLVSNLAKNFDPFKQLSINTGMINLNNTSINTAAEEKTIIKVEGTKTQNYEHEATSSEAHNYDLVEFQDRKRNNVVEIKSNPTVKQPIELKKSETSSIIDNGEANDDEFHMLTKPFTEVIRRVKTKNLNEENKPMRRISYLRATNNEINNDFQIGVTNDVIESKKEKNMIEEQQQQHIKSSKIKDEYNHQNHNQKQYTTTTCSTSVQTETIQKCEIFEKSVTELACKNDAKSMTDYYETEMELKSSCIYGRRVPEYRSWRHVKIELSGDNLKIYLIRSSKSDNNVIDLNVKQFNIIDETVDKKKFIFRLQSKPLLNNVIEIKRAQEQSIATSTTNQNNNIETIRAPTINEYTEILFKTKNLSDMKKLFGLIQEKCENDENLQVRQLAEPQKTVAISSVSTYCEETTTNTAVKQQATTKEYSPLLNSKSSASNASVTNGAVDSEITTESISPVMKTRKSHSKFLSDKELGSPKSKNWKDLLFRRIHNSSNSEVSHSTGTSIGGISPKYVGSIGVPLKYCPMSKENEFVPMIVFVCTKIVETKGLQVVGIYRIPGNKAAISELKDQVNKNDFQWDSVDTDFRWDDVNVVSSLLKLFIRSLPDALLPGTSYINFIEADKKSGERRLKELCYLLRTLPPQSYETMKHIIKHLNKVSKNCEVNLMEPKNLAIIFGPSIIRIPNETLDMAVKDMKHQCRIVELLVSQYDYFFDNGELPEASSPPIITTSAYADQTSLLLDNVSKIEQRLHDKESLTSRFIPHLRRRAHSKRNAIGSDTYSGESVLSLEYKKFSETPMKENIAHSSSSSNASKNTERGSVEISILLTDEDSSNSRLSDTGSMSLTTITDALDSKLRSLRSGSESTDDTSENSPNKTATRRTFPQPLILHENIPFADESPERHMLTNNKNIIASSTSNDTTCLVTPLKNLPISSRSANFIRDIQKNISTINNQRFSSVYESCSDDSEVSTTSDPKEAIVISPLFLERYKKRRDYRLFRSASFNCRNYTSRSSSNNGNMSIGNGGNNTNTLNSLTKDEKTDMNLTKKRQIQNKQNRSIKRRHTVGGPHDYSTTTITRKNLNSNENHILEVGIRIKNINRRN